MKLEELYAALHDLESQKICIEQQILQVKKEIEKRSTFSKQQKINLFKKFFVAREDLYPLYWVSRDGLKKGYSPKTYTFKGTDYIPLNDTVIQSHLEGKVRLGTYAVINQTMAKFLVLDLDKTSFVEDARAIKNICDDLNLLPLFEISKSGNGIHIWFFFETLVSASSARKLGDILITKAMDVTSGIDMNSYDRMFPNQDFVAPDALGNLIALPLHYRSRAENKTVFVDIDTMQPFADQWAVLQNVKKIPSEILSKILQKQLLYKNNNVDTLMPWEIKHTKPLTFPKSIKIVLYDAIYIEKTELSKELLNFFKRLSSFSNPEFYIRQNLRKSTFNTPRVISMFDLNERYIILPRGVLTKVKPLFEKNGVNLIIEDKRVVQEIKKQQFNIDLRDEQNVALSKVLKDDYALLIAPPGFGKTVVAAAVIAKRKVNTLILVHKVTLLEQWIQRLSEYFLIDKKELGQLGKGKKRLTSNIDVAMLQSLKNRPELIENYSQIIVDEAHHIPAVSFEVPLKRFQGRYVLGLSATPKRQDGMHPIMSMQCGEIVYEAKRDKKIIHTLKTVRTQFEPYGDDFVMMLGEIVEDHTRNKLIIDEIEKLDDRNVLVISERIEHLHILYHGLRNRKIDVTLLYGGMGTKVQKEAMSDAKTAKIILSTSGYIGEGIDFSHLDTIVFTMPISYSGRIVQYLGRIGRRGQRCLAVDFVDENVMMFKSSFTKRLKGYRQMGYKQHNEKNVLKLF